MIRSRLYAVMLLISVAFLLAACSPAESTGAPVEPELISLVATDIAFDKTQLEGDAGRPIRITLENKGVLEHDFSIVEIATTGEVTEESEEQADHDMGHVEEEPDVHVAATSGTSSTIEFTPAEAGQYEYYCTVSGHREAGMVGTLTVSEP